MNKEEDYASDSEESDDDFIPKGEHSDLGSEEESEDISDDENHEESKESESKKSSPTKRNQKSTLNNSSKRSKLDDSSDKEDKQNGVYSRRQTRRGEDIDSKKIIEKDEIESDEEDKNRSDSLWADFLSDVKKPPPGSSSSKTFALKQTKQKEISSSPKTQNGNISTKNLANNKKPVEEKASSKLVTVTEVVDFAGEAVSIQKTVPADSIKENQSSISKPNPAKSIPPLTKRPAIGGGGSVNGGGAGGLGSLLNQIGKKKKISILEKSKLDWNSFKQTEGIEEEVQTFNKGKDGFLERQDFLQRTDLRQFEIEKNYVNQRETKNFRMLT